MSDSQDDVNKQRLLGSLAPPPKAFLGTWPAKRKKRVKRLWRRTGAAALK